MPIKIKPVETADDIAAFIGVAYAMVRESNFSNLEFSAAVFALRLAGYAAADHCLALLAEDAHGLAVGGIIATLGESDFGPDLIAQDHGVYVHKGYRGSSAGRQLINAYTQWAKDKGAKRICFGVQTGIDPDRTAKFLSRLGYRAVGHCLIYQE